MDRVLVTGGAGFLGSHVCERWLAEGAEVTCLDNYLTGRRENVAHLEGRPGFTVVHHDISRPYLPPRPPSIVLHMASPASPVAYQANPIETLRVGSQGTAHALDIARAAGAVFLLASTSEVYGDPQAHPQSESYHGNVSPTGPRSVYDEAKRYAEALTMAYHRTQAVDTRIARIFNTYGPRQTPGDGRAIPNFVTQALMGQPLTVYGNGSQTRSFCYVDDLVDGLVRLVRQGGPDPVNLGNPDERSIIDVAKLVIGLTGSTSEIEFRDLPRDDPLLRCPDITRARDQLGWQPSVELRTGLERTMEWFRSALELDGERQARTRASRRRREQPRAPRSGGRGGMNVSVIGTGHVGLVTSAVLAKLGHQVTGIDCDEGKIALLSNGASPFYEPGLEELLEEQMASGHLRFTADPSQTLPDADVVFICVGTPPTPNGDASLVAVENGAREVARHASDGVVVVAKSTVPAGTAERVRLTLSRERPGLKFRLVSNPEFLREGRAIHDSLHPDRILIGADNARAFQAMRRLYRPLIRKKCLLIETDIATAELAKHACNAFLSLKISFANALAAVCERAGADVVGITDVMGSDPRIGRAFLDAGLGYGGYCFPKDLVAFQRLAARLGYEFSLLSEVARINEQAVEAVVEKVREALWNVDGKKVALLGLAFKPGTDDTRFSPALSVARRLLAHGAVVTGYDPRAAVNAKAELPELEVASDPYEAAWGAHCLILCTEWEEFRALDLGVLQEVMLYPVVVDGRNFFDTVAMRRSGFIYYPTGRPPVLDARPHRGEPGPASRREVPPPVSAHRALGELAIWGSVGSPHDGNGRKRRGLARVEANPHGSR